MDKIKKHKQIIHLLNDKFKYNSNINKLVQMDIINTMKPLC